MHENPTFAAIVLCGGQSTRMGSPKAELTLGGESLLARTVRIVSQVAQPVVVVAATEQNTPSLATIIQPGQAVEVVRDARPERGPLEGLAAGLRTIVGRFDRAFVAPCDLPLLKPEFVRRMVQMLGDEFDAAAPNCGGQLHPLPAVYRVSVLPQLESHLTANQLSLHGLLRQIATRHVTERELTDIDPQLDSLRNVNTPEQWGAICREFAPGS